LSYNIATLYLNASITEPPEYRFTDVITHTLHLRTCLRLGYKLTP